MRERTLLVWILLTIPALAVVPAGAQGIQTASDIETDGQLVSQVAPGTAPLQVSSSAKVDNLNADLLDGRIWRDFVLLTELEAAGVFLFDLLDNPDPPCFNTTHRFVDCGNGTVTDTTTVLIWLKNASCFSAMRNYAQANETAAALYDGADIDPSGSDCGLSDGSRLGDWRLPTKAEWEGVLDSSCTSAPRLVGNGSPTPGCHSDGPWATGALTFYWSSGTTVSSPTNAWYARLNAGGVPNGLKVGLANVWPVRGRH